MTLKLALGLLAMWILSWVFTTIQVRHYRQFINELRRSLHGGYISSGVVRSTFRRGCVVVMAVDSAGSIVSAYAMEGRSTFAQFRPYEKPVGRAFTEFVDGSELSGIKEKALQKACELLEEQMIRSVMDPIPSAG